MLGFCHGLISFNVSATLNLADSHVEKCIILPTIKETKPWQLTAISLGNSNTAVGNFIFVRVFTVAWDMLSAVLIKSCLDLVQTKSLQMT